MEIPEPRKRRGNEEEKIQNKIRAKMEEEGWLTEKMHGNKFQSGIPDLYCYHPEHGHKWVEVKTAKGYLTSAQGAKFKNWEKYDLGVYILISFKEIPLLKGKPNWRRFEHKIAAPKRDFIGYSKERKDEKERRRAIRQNVERVNKSSPKKLSFDEFIKRTVSAKRNRRRTKDKPGTD